MKLTEEQNEIISHDDEVIIKALAGSGKTTTLYHFIKTRKDDSRILYLAFNKSVQEEAVKKFEDIHHVYVHVKTAHSMAYKAIITKLGYKVEELTVEYIMERFKCDYIIGNHVLKYFTLYSSSAIKNVADVDYRQTISTASALEIYDNYVDDITMMVRKIVADMFYNKMPVTHDYYLKLWYMKNPRLDRDYDYILFDEGQDASEIMLEIFKNQNCKKIIVGDEHQQIYSWRNAVNSLDKVEGKVFKLTRSFRFEQNIADLAIKIIKWKKDLFIDKSVEDFNILGCGALDKVKSKAVIARTNVGLISNAIEEVVLRKRFKKPYFEGGFKGYSINAMYSPINDIKAIEKRKYDKIKTARLKDIKTILELKDFIEKTEDILLGQALALHEKFGDKLLDYINKLKENCIEDKNDSDCIFTTAHKSKGMEYDSVTILEDFKSKSDFIGSIMRSEDKSTLRKLINEEINLLYVAVTRSRKYIFLPEQIEEDLKEDEKI